MAHGRTIFLVGFMGCGKTEVGRRLAARVGLPFVDLDERVAAAAGKPVAAIFAEDGEAAFRSLETHALESIEPIVIQGVVVASGGGTWLQPANREWMRTRGVTVWLDASAAALEGRVARDGSRPLFGDGPAVERLLAARRPAYAEATLRVDTSALDAGAVTDAVLAALAADGRREEAP